MTNTDVCAGVISRYMEALSDDFKAIPSDSGCFLLTPFDRPDGEGIELEIETLPSGHILISDMGDSLGYLYINGLTLSQTVLAKIKCIAMSYGVSLEASTLNIETESESAGQALHQIIQSVLSVTDLIQTRRSAGTNKIRFDNEVESFIIYSGVTYDAGFEVRGKRENHEFRFHVNSEKKLLIQPITASSETAAHTWAERWAYRFRDVIDVEETWNMFAILDDRSEQSGRADIWTPNSLAPIEEYAIPWAERDRLTELLQVTQPV